MSTLSQQQQEGVPQMMVRKRSGTLVPVDFNKILKRVNQLCRDDLTCVAKADIVKKTINGLYDGVTTSELDNLAARNAHAMSTHHWHYNSLAGRIAISNLHKETKEKFSEVVTDLYNYHNSNKHQPLVARPFYETVMKHAEKLDAAIQHDRDYEYTYFGFKTLEYSYLLKINNVIVERPQHMLMRTALAIHEDDVDEAIKTYGYLSEKYYTHATPTLLNAGRIKNQLSSCYLMSVNDNTSSIFGNLWDCAVISQTAGGIGLNLSNIRGNGAFLASSNGYTSGIVPLLRLHDANVGYIDQGGRRPGALAAFLEPWHVDVFDFLDCKKNSGKEEFRARNLFYGLWIPDLFMWRVFNDENWTLMCPVRCPGLNDVYGQEFEDLYSQYERDGKGSRTIKAQALWQHIVETQSETGTPYMLYKDHINHKSNQKNLGPIRCSNLCTEIVQYTEADQEGAVCNLASICLNKFMSTSQDYGGRFDYDFAKLKEVTKLVVYNLNKLIDNSWYPMRGGDDNGGKDKTDLFKHSNLRHRPIGIGVQGLADTFAQLRFPFDSDGAKQLNKYIFETMYYAALEASCELAEKYGPYETYEGSPISQGILQFDMWTDEETGQSVQPIAPHNNWEALRDKIKKHGVRNSLLLTAMPTASTAQILGNNESIESFTNNVYSRRVSAGEFQLVNKYLFKDLVDLGLWTPSIRNQILLEKGSIQNIPEIPNNLKKLYKTVWEISQKVVIDLAADRAPFICQSQSLNIHMAEPTYKKISSMHFYGWKKGLKTGQYYLRTKSATEAIPFTLDTPSISCTREANCFNCGS